MEELLLEALGKLLNKKPAELKATLKAKDGELVDNAKDLILSQIEDHVEIIKKDSLNDGRKKGMAEGMGTFEKKLVKKFNFDNKNGLEGIDLVKAVVADNTGGSDNQQIKKLQSELEEAKKHTQISDDDIKKSQLYVTLEKQFQDSQSEHDEKIKEQEKQIRGEYQKKEQFNKIKTVALEQIEGLNLALPDDPKIKSKQLDRLVFSQMEEYDYQFDDDTPKPIIIDKETGKRKENKLGHALDFNEFLESIAKSSFPAKVSKQKDPPGPGNPPNPKPGNGEIDLSKYKNSDDIIKDREIPLTKRKEMVKQFEEQQN